MKNVLVSDDIGTPIYFDHPDGRLMCMPVSTTHDMMAANFGPDATFSSISCGAIRIVFQRYADGCINLALLSDEGESEGFLSGQLRLIYDILLMLFGPRTLLPPHVRQFNFLRHREAVSRVVDTMLWLAAHQQSFLVESIELIDINDFIRTQCLEALRSALADVPHAQHALLFAGTKVIATYTKSGVGTRSLSNHDVFLLMLFMMGQFHSRARSLDETALPIADYTDHARAFQERDRRTREGLDNSPPPSDEQPLGCNVEPATRFVDTDLSASFVTTFDSDDGFESAVDELPSLNRQDSSLHVTYGWYRVVDRIIAAACGGKRLIQASDDADQIELRRVAAAVQTIVTKVESFVPEFPREQEELGEQLAQWCEHAEIDPSTLLVRKRLVDALVSYLVPWADRSVHLPACVDVTSLETVLKLADLHSPQLAETLSGPALAVLVVCAGEELLAKSSEILSTSNSSSFQRSRGVSSAVAPSTMSFMSAAGANPTTVAGRNATTAAVLGPSGGQPGRLRSFVTSAEPSRMEVRAARSATTDTDDKNDYAQHSDDALSTTSSLGLATASDHFSEGDDGIISDTLDGLNLTDEGNTPASSSSVESGNVAGRRGRFVSEEETQRLSSASCAQQLPQSLEPVYSALYLRTGASQALALNWCFFSELQAPITLVIVNVASSVRPSQVRNTLSAAADGCIGSTQERDVLQAKQESVKEALRNYIDYLVTKDSAHLSILSYLHQLPGLVHFIFVDRTADRVIAPTIGPLHGSECAAAFDAVGIDTRGEDASERMVRILQQEVWQLCYHAHRYRSQGYCSMSVRAGNFRYNYRLWLEDSNRTEIPLTNSLASSGAGGDRYKSIVERTPRAAKCFELYTLFIGLIPSHLIHEYERRLINLVDPHFKT